MYSDPLLFRDGLGYCPGFPPGGELEAWRRDRRAVEGGAPWTPEMRLRVALFHYVFWNDWVNAYADWTYKVEEFDADEIARRASLGPPRPPARPMPAAAAENSRAMDPPSRALPGRTSSGFRRWCGGARRGWRASLATTTEFKGHL